MNVLDNFKNDKFCGEIIHGDCIEVMKLVPDNSFPLTVTDIPYGKVNRKSNGLRNLDKGDADILTFKLSKFVPECIRVTSGSIYIFCGTEQVSEIRKIMVDHKLSTRLCIWEKTNPSPMNGKTIWLSGIECCVYGKKSKATFNEHCKNTIWRYPTVRSKIHPTQKPQQLIEYLITVSSNEKDIVFDPCVGSGTTAIAAHKLNRRFFACDLSEAYVQAALQRLEEASNSNTKGKIQTP